MSICGEKNKILVRTIIICRMHFAFFLCFLLSRITISKKNYIFAAYSQETALQLFYSINALNLYFSMTIVDFFILIQIRLMGRCLPIILRLFICMFYLIMPMVWLGCSGNEDFVDNYGLNTPSDSSYFSVSGIMKLNNKPFGNSQQGMAVWDSLAFVFNEGGFCRIIDLHNKQQVALSRLASFDSSNHANTVSFGDFFQSDDDVPLFYVSRWEPPVTCFVEHYNMSTNRFELLQTITTVHSRYQGWYSNFVIDSDSARLYTVMTEHVADSILNIRSYHIPDLDERKITLNSDDVLSEVELNLRVAHIWQGVFIYEHQLMILYGGWNDSERGMLIVNLADYKTKNHDFSWFPYEPEAVAFYNHSLIMNTNGYGVYYLWHFKWHQEQDYKNQSLL